MNNYYKLPLALDIITQKKAHPLCSLPQSIAQNLYLLLITHFGESHFNKKFGCLIWEKDFELISNIQWMATIQPGLLQAVEKAEKRLSKIEVDVILNDFEFANKVNRRIKKLITIKVRGVIVKTNEPFAFSEKIYVSPLSFD